LAEKRLAFRWSADRRARPSLTLSFSLSLSLRSGTSTACPRIFRPRAHEASPRYKSTWQRDRSSLSLEERASGRDERERERERERKGTRAERNLAAAFVSARASDTSRPLIAARYRARGVAAGAGGEERARVRASQIRYLPLSCVHLWISLVRKPP